MVDTDTTLTVVALAGAIAALVGLVKPFLIETLHVPKPAIPIVVLVAAEIVTNGSVIAPEVELYAGHFTASIAALPLAMSAVGAREIFVTVRGDAEEGGAAPGAGT